MAKRLRSDSTASQIAAFSAAQKPIEPPKLLNENEMMYWVAITRARAREDWTEIDLYHAWNLAKLQWLIEQSHAEIDEQGMTVVNSKGTQIDNPAFSRLEKLTRLALSLSTKLHVHAEATVGKSEDSANQATKQREAQQVMNDMDGLIAMPPRVN